MLVLCSVCLEWNKEIYVSLVTMKVSDFYSTDGHTVCQRLAEHDGVYLMRGFVFHGMMVGFTIYLWNIICFRREKYGKEKSELICLTF